MMNNITGHVFYFDVICYKSESTLAQPVRVQVSMYRVGIFSDFKEFNFIEWSKAHKNIIFLL